jgi:hypothetical protein
MDPIFQIDCRLNIHFIHITADYFHSINFYVNLPVNTYLKGASYLSANFNALLINILCEKAREVKFDP